MTDTTPRDPSPSQPGPPKVLWAIGGVIVVAVIVVVAVLLTRDDDGDDVADTDTTTSTTEATTTTTEATTTTTPDASATTMPDEVDVDLSGAATTPVSVPPPGTPTAQLTNVRVGTHQGYVRTVFEFDGELPGYDIGFVDGPMREDGSGDEVPVEGTRTISVRMTPASAVVLGADSFTRTYDGPDRFTSEGGAVTEVVEVGDFEAQMTWAIGTTEGQPFKVSSLSNPTRLIIDVINV
jgi:hypothetical protein